MFTRIFSILRSIIAILFSFISNSILVSLFLTFLVTIVDVHQWKWVQTILQWLKWPVTQNNAFALFFCVFLVLPFLLSPSRLMAWILAKTNGWRKAGAEEKDYIQSHIDNVLSRGGLKKKKYHLYIVEDPDINAAAFGVNNILVTRGTMIAAEQNPGLMEGFLAHEMGHITYGHSFVLSFIIVMESCGRASSYVLEKINWFLAEVVGRIPLINLVSFFIVLSISLIFIILGVFNKITNYIILWFFRQDEHAADGYACKIGFGPELLHGLELLEKSSASEEKKGVLANINNDHPSLPHRIETIQKYLEKHPEKTHAYLP